MKRYYLFKKQSWQILQMWNEYKYGLLTKTLAVKLKHSISVFTGCLLHVRDTQKLHGEQDG